MDLAYGTVHEPVFVLLTPPRRFTVSARRDPDTSTFGVSIVADEATKRWASEATTRGGEASHGRARVLGFVVDLLRQYADTDRPVYRGIALEPWERELADHEHTTESIASYFRSVLKANFTRERIVVELDRTPPDEPDWLRATPKEQLLECRRLARLVSRRGAT